MTSEFEKDLADGVAIIAMVGRFPGADDVPTLWRNLCHGEESITFFNENELHPSIDSKLRNNPNYVRAKGIIADVDQFDAAFFGINPREAEVMDPQQRLMLEAAWQVLETAGYDAERYDGLIGVFAGMNNADYFASNVSSHRDLIAKVGEFQTMLANEKDFLATRISYKLNLKGPSVNLFTGCSTSLVAVCQAFQSLITYQCDMALAGGVSITFPIQSGYLYQEGGMLSPDGHCRPFDADAQGTTFNNGLGLVVLKRYEDAVRDRDQIYAVIRGVGVNNDGSSKVSFTAPSVDGQAEAILMACDQAEVDPDTLSYIETHGTGTPLGDPIEVEALTKVFRTKTEAKGFCALGSVKSNVGHLVHAAGVTGLIKTALALHSKQIPPTLFFKTPNPKIDLESTPFYVNKQLMKWKQNSAPLRAGVSSFGVGGTNAHVILQEAPPRSTSGPSRPKQLLILSAKTENALEQATLRLHEHIKTHPELSLADIAYTLQRGRKEFGWRRTTVCSSHEEAIEALGSSNSKKLATCHTQRRGSPVVFMFPGQGAQYVHMGANLYEFEPSFRDTLDQCAEILQPLIDKDIREILYPKDGNLEAAANILQQTAYTQPALFVVSYALAKLWEEWDVLPQAMIGHSVGEFVAACLSGIFSVEDALKLVAIRGRLMQSLPAGSMLSVRLPAETVFSRLGSDLSIAAINAPNLTVISGPTPAIESLKTGFDSEKIPCRLLRTSHAFHSSMMDPIVGTFEREVSQLTLSAPQIPILSTATATWLSDAEAMDPHYWAQHLRNTVYFSEGVRKLWEDPDRILLEVGPRTTTTTLARQLVMDRVNQVVVPSLDDNADDQTEWTALLSAVSKLWLAGVSIDWNAFTARELRNRVELPTYPFEYKRFWVEPAQPATVTSLHEHFSNHRSQEGGDPAMQHNHQDETKQVTVASSAASSRRDTLVGLLRGILEETSGMDLADVEESTTFFEMGLDSLFLTQASLEIQKQFEVPVSFRQMLEDFPDMASLADHLDRELPPELFSSATSSPDGVEQQSSHLEVERVLNGGEQLPTIGMMMPAHELGQSSGQYIGQAGVERVIAEQIKLMSQQLQIMRGQSIAAQPLAQPSSVPTDTSAERNDQRGVPARVLNEDPKVVEVKQAGSRSEAKVSRVFGPGANINKSQTNNLTMHQKGFLEALIERYTKKTARSKAFTQKHRAKLADPRSVSGFTPLWKEMVYPIVTNRSSGSKLWDLDGNEYVDLTNGFGPIMLGHSPAFVTEAVKAQLDQGIETGPQTTLAGDVAELFCELTGNERMAFCNTGSEAVLAAIRLSRTVTGRSKVAIFAGGYHGIIDEVIVRGTPSGRTIPGAPGIMPGAVENMMVLEYGDPKSIEILRANARDLAAVMVEPVQSRRPDLQPVEFLKELRQLTQDSGSALVFDEVVTGFRVHPGGAQAYFDIRADLATYGKVAGGGYPIGIVAGRSKFMDALDGGFWQYGDQSFPEVGVTFFAGTFVRHPLNLAATKVVLEYLKAQGPDLQQNLNKTTESIARDLNAFISQRQVPINLGQFSSFFYPSFPHGLTYGGLLFYLLRERGIHVWEHRPCFLTTAHSQADISLIVEAFKQSLTELQEADLLPNEAGEPRHENSVARSKTTVPQPPIPGAKLGRDPKGDPAWFAPDPERPGKYVQVGRIS
jgi:acyl transferase domain-containing protein/acetylornithine/succinyldiaminopimelate/putrescine aminotransferase